MTPSRGRRAGGNVDTDERYNALRRSLHAVSRCLIAYPTVNVRDIESGQVRGTRSVWSGLDFGRRWRPSRPSLRSVPGVRLLRCRGDVTANIVKRDWRRLGKRWQWKRGLEYLSNFYQRLFEITVPLKNQSRRKAILLPFAKRAANGRIHCQ